MCVRQRVLHLVSLRHRAEQCKTTRNCWSSLSVLHAEKKKKGHHDNRTCFQYRGNVSALFHQHVLQGRLPQLWLIGSREAETTFDRHLQGYDGLSQVSWESFTRWCLKSCALSARVHATARCQLSRSFIKLLWVESLRSFSQFSDL